jgi:uncharacterized coiled-coil DUF342 family protein
MTKTEREIQELQNSLASKGERLDTARDEIKWIKEQLTKLSSQIEALNEKSHEVTLDFQSRLAV